MVNHVFALEKLLNKDMCYVEGSMHEDFLSVQEYEMVSLDEFLQQMKDWFEDPTLDLRNANLRVLTDNEDFHTFQQEWVKDGQRIRQTNVTFFKDRKIYRHMGHNVQILYDKNRQPSFAYIYHHEDGGVCNARSSRSNCYGQRARHNTWETMTKLAAIRNNHLSIRCWFGHAGLIPVKAFIEKFGPDMIADQAVTRTRRTKCGASVRAASQIVYVGSSAFAMSGSRTAQDSEGVRGWLCKLAVQALIKRRLLSFRSLAL